MAFLLCSFCIAFSQRWKAHASEHALSGGCIHSVDGYPEGTDLIEWNKKWTKDPKGGWNCSQPSLPVRIILFNLLQRFTIKDYNSW